MTGLLPNIVYVIILISLVSYLALRGTNLLGKVSRDKFILLVILETFASVVAHYLLSKVAIAGWANLLSGYGLDAAFAFIIALNILNFSDKEARKFTLYFLFMNIVLTLVLGIIIGLFFMSFFSTAYFNR